MTKYVVGYEEQCLFICKTRADAEEMILSFAEENIYENWFMDNCTKWGDRPYETPAEYIIDNGKNCPEVSTWAWALYSFSSGYWIDEVEEFD